MQSPGLSLLFRLAGVAFCLAASSEAQIHVNLYNDVGAADRTIDEALRDADRILLSAGVRVTWSSCRPSDPGRNPCAAPGPVTLQLRLYPAAAESKFPVAQTPSGSPFRCRFRAMGSSSVSFTNGWPGLALRDRMKAGQLLGHVMAHEMGHLLMEGCGHAADGIMKFPWRGKELDRVRRGMLLFLPGQARIRPRPF